MNRPRRFLLWFLSGLLAAIALAEVTARIAEASGPPALRWYDASTQLKVEQMEGLESADVVFAGTSMVWQGLVPAEFTAADPEGRAAYNAALAGGVPQVMEPWLLEQVVPRLNPDLVIWGLSSMDFSASYGEDNLERYRDALETREGALASVERIASRVSALVRYRTVLRSPSSLVGAEAERVEADFAEAAAELGDRGERLDFEIDVGAERGRQVETRLRDYRLDPADIDAIDRTVADLRGSGIEVVLVEMPVPDRYVTLHPGGAADVERGHQAIVALADLIGVEVVDLRFGYTDDDFVDFTHLDREAAASLSARLAEALGPGADEPGGPAPDDPPDTSTTRPPSTTSTTAVPPPMDSLLATTRRAVETVDALHGLLYAGEGTLTTPGYWTSGRHAGKHGDMADAADAGGFETVFVGSSIVDYGFDPVLFAEVDGRSAFNTGLPNLTPEKAAVWLDSVVRLADPDLVVYGIVPWEVRRLQRVEGTCLDSAEDWEWSEQLRTDAFAPIDVLAGIPWENLLFGDPVEFEASRRYRSGFNEFGGRLDHPEVSAAELQESVDRVAWEGPFETCPERIEVVASIVSRLKGEGRSVVLVFMPLSDTRAAMFEGGREEIGAILDDLERAASGAGADAVIDFSSLVPEEQFGDMVHVDAGGSEALTRALAQRLGELGL